MRLSTAGTGTLPRLLPGLAGVGLAALPKCPMCLLAYAGLAGSSALAAYETWLPAVIAGLLSASAGALALRARSERRCADACATAGTMAGPEAFREAPPHHSPTD
jgi:hypothetical protein